jgi:hypothetical protein
MWSPALRDHVARPTRLPRPVPGRDGEGEANGEQASLLALLNNFKYDYLLDWYTN